MNELQKQILNIIQARFPIVERPFIVLAEQLGSREEIIIHQINRLKEEGYIRYIGPVFEAGHLGYVGTLVAAKVPPEKVAPFVAEVNALPGVSHNYGREHDYNVWCTLTAPGKEVIDAAIERLRRKYELPAIYSLPAEKMFKIKVNFHFKLAVDSDVPEQSGTETDDDLPGIDTSMPAASLTGRQISLIRQLQEDLPLVLAPFHRVAEAVGADVEEVLRQIRQWKASGLIRRFGARIRHVKAGFAANGMVVFEIEPPKLNEAGGLLAEYRQVSHCYHRLPACGWPYNLFAMIHCRNKLKLRELVKEMVERLEPLRYDVLLTTREYKKSRVKYFLEEVK